jgi:hypothetical protein
MRLDPKANTPMVDPLALPHISYPPPPPPPPSSKFQPSQGLPNSNKQMAFSNVFDFPSKHELTPWHSDRIQEVTKL